MAESTLDLRHAPKDRAYPQLRAHMIGVLAGIDDDIAGMATMSALVHNAFGHLWTGFYRVVGPTLLRIGPYQGTVGCLEIEFGRGVCGTAAAERRAIAVADVERFPGHITCDPRSKSEIVVPVLDRAGSLIAVFDVDSTRRAAFDQQDVAGLEQMVRWFAGEGRG
ncbi:MAG TPA: GAF domain-containing protein [Gemmatimonadaceae bacterium]|jgi:L-methionine (R)-S-oxide reductase|nr:GAF domain-containing protein [Gemmatimonadaceae bacterium]